MVEKLLWMLKYLERQPAAQENYHAVIKEEMETLLKQAKKAFDSNKDVVSIENIASD
jgi:hypothetical protein